MERAGGGGARAPRGSAGLTPIVTPRLVLVPVASGLRWELTLAGETIGEGGAVAPVSEHGEVELDFAVVEQMWNLGYATEAVTAMCEHLIRQAGVRRIVAVTNGVASRRVLAKAGFRAVVGGRYAMLAR